MKLRSPWLAAFAFSSSCQFKTTSLAISASMKATTESSVSEPSAPSQLLISLRHRLGSWESCTVLPLGESSTSSSTIGELVLASQSPRRREILDLMGLSGKYTVEPSPLNESELQQDLLQQKLPPRDYTRCLAEAKARALASSHTSEDEESNDAVDGNAGKDIDRPAVFYLGSDTIVELDEKILEKPRDAEDAKQMLLSMSGRQHHVHTGVALYRLYKNQVSLVASFTDTASVTFLRLGEDDIDAYIASGEPMDKAGSYGIQGIGGQLVENISGDFFTVMGLPMSRTSRLVARALQDEIENSTFVEQD